VHVERMGETRDVRIPNFGLKRSVWRPICRWKNNIKIDIQEIEYDVRWLYLSQDSDQKQIGPVNI
jgi:hypothetical protein